MSSSNHRNPVPGATPNSSFSRESAATTQANRLGETLRFLWVALAGFAVDIGVVWSLINFYGIPEQVACVVGFALATAGCFFAHKSWTFRNAPQATLWRFLGYWTITLFTLVVRLLLFTQLGEAFTREELPIPVRLAIAGGVAFVLAYLLSNKLVFGGRETASSRTTAD